MQRMKLNSLIYLCAIVEATIETVSQNVSVFALKTTLAIVCVYISPSHSKSLNFSCINELCCRTASKHTQSMNIVCNIVICRREQSNNSNQLAENTKRGNVKTAQIIDGNSHFIWIWWWWKQRKRWIKLQSTKQRKRKNNKAMKTYIQRNHLSEAVLTLLSSICIRQMVDRDGRRSLHVACLSLVFFFHPALHTHTASCDIMPPSSQQRHAFIVVVVVNVCDHDFFFGSFI